MYKSPVFYSKYDSRDYHMHAFFCTSAKSSQVYRNAIGIIAPAGRDS